MPLEIIYYLRQRARGLPYESCNGSFVVTGFVLNGFPYWARHVTREVINKGAAADCFFDTSRFSTNMASTSRWVATLCKSFL